MLLASLMKLQYYQSRLSLSLWWQERCSYWHFSSWLELYDFVSLFNLMDLCWQSCEVVSFSGVGAPGCWARSWASETALCLLGKVMAEITRAKCVWLMGLNADLVWPCAAPENHQMPVGNCDRIAMWELTWQDIIINYWIWWIWQNNKAMKSCRNIFGHSQDF